MKYVSADQDRQIREVMRRCGQQAQALAQSFQVFQKGAGDYVTNVDRLLDQELLRTFAGLFPDDGIITEENFSSQAAFGLDYQRLWCIDPLDGTEDFIQHKSYYAIMVGLLANFMPVAGWVYGPYQDELYYGGPDWGLFQVRGEEPPAPLIAIEPSLPGVNRQFPIVLGEKDQRNFGPAIVEAVPGAFFYSLGSFGLKVLEVIQGRAGLYIYLNGRVKLWDTTGPLALAKAAGLVCCDLTGRPLEWTPDWIEADTLIHKQAIMVGWPGYVETFGPKIQAAVQ